MKLLRVGEPNNEKPAVMLRSGEILDVSSAVGDYNEDFFANQGIENLAYWLIENQTTAPVINSSIRIGPPVAKPGKIICIGLNYRDHAQEGGWSPPTEPVLFTKAVTALSGPYDPIVLPPNSTHTDWEVELAFVIKQKAKHVAKEQATTYLAGYTMMNDVSERYYQKECGGQWVKGKSYDSFAPLGPCLLTPDEVPDPHNLAVSLEVNGERMQTGNTADLIFDVPHLISYISQFMTLMPGDVISTGTPAGVGMGKKPPRYLKDGDVVVLSIDIIGEQRQQVVAST